MIGQHDEELLQAQLDGALSGDEAAALAQQLERTPELQARAADLSQLASVLESCSAPEMPATLRADIMTAVGSRQASHQATPWIQAHRRGSEMTKKIVFGLGC